MSSLKREEILLLFDVHGTLTPQRAVIEPDFEEFFYSQIKPRATIGIISGANLEQLFTQLNGPNILSEFDYVFPEHGTIQIEKGVEIGKQLIQGYLSEDILQRFINYTLRYISNLILPIKRGNFIEFRNGMMNISPMGRYDEYISNAERNMAIEYNTKHQIIEKMISMLKEEFNEDLMFSIGGQLSFDVLPKGWDKTNCLTHVTNGTNFKEIHFFGDKTDPGGNDHEIFNDPRTIGHKVASPKDTQNVLTEIFKLNVDNLNVISTLNLNRFFGQMEYILNNIFSVFNQFL